MTCLTNEEMDELDSSLIANALKLRFFPLDIDKGRGCRLFDAAGKAYLDLTGGWALANTGYDHPRVKKAIAEQLDRSTYIGLISSMHQPACRLAEKLIGLVPGDFEKKVWFGHSGSDASETVGRLLPLATGKRRLVSFIGSYHGSTDASMGMSAHSAMTPFIGGANVVKVPYPHPYRCPFGEDAGDCGERSIRFLEDYIFKTICPPEDVAGIIVEAVQSDGGDIVPPANFLPLLEDVCRRHNIYLVVDEVKVGLGRTGRMFAFQHAGITPDAVILGKSLGGGLPLSAVVARREILDVGFALFTTSGNATCCAAGLAAIEAIEQDGLAENARRIGEYLHQKLKQLQEKHTLIGDVRGMGMIQGVELVKDRISKEPAVKETAKIAYRAYELGLLVFYVGLFSNVLEITPPLIMTKAEVDEGVELLDRAISDVCTGKINDECIGRYTGW
ncbi:MAG: aspartate aminotransferase family protein [Anaerolineales bacterium]|nr:aspartate aminotransferase family protein [Anaerolineales bacterium]